MKQVLFKVEEKSDGYLDVSFSGQISKTEMTRTIIGFVSVGFTIFEVIQHYIH